MQALPQRHRRSRKNDRGAIAILISLSMLALVIVGGITLDFGLVRIDRQQNKLAADDAVMAGLRAADKGTTEIFSEEGVCGALAFLIANRPDLAGLPLGDCETPDPDATCSPSTPFVYTGSVTSRGTSYRVTIQNPYEVGPTSGFPEDAYASLVSDVSAIAGCDQIGVIIEQSRNPGLGSLAGPDDLHSRVRSVGRVHIAPGEDAPAMLLLKRTGCPVLRTGSASDDNSWVHVYGAISQDAPYFAQAGSIHADSDGLGCSSSSIFEGRGANGVVAYAAPLLTNPLVADPRLPGLLTSVAGANGVPLATIRDASPRVYSSGGLNEAQASSAPKLEPKGRALVTREAVDDRYLDGVTGAMSDANDVFTALSSAAAAAAAGYTVVSSCDPSGTISATKVYIDCTDNNGYKGTATIEATTVVFNGKVNPPSAGGAVSLPNAEHVYIFGSGADAVTIGNGSTFSMHTTNNIDGSTCRTDTNPGAKAVLFVKDGQFKQTGGLLRLCNTTVFMMGGRADGCLPSLGYLAADPVVAPAPTLTPCDSGAAMGTGQFTQTGGGVDWTAPNRKGATKLANGDPDPAMPGLWGDPDGPEDLALWSESGGNTSSTTYNMAGGGLFNVRGVFMVPNADSFIISGGANLVLTNAQYIATSIVLAGAGTKINMRVDPYSAVTLPELNPFTLVR